MVATWIYDPATDEFARVVRRGPGWQAQCFGRYLPADDEREAVEAAEQMLDHRAKERKRPAR